MLRAGVSFLADILRIFILLAFYFVLRLLFVHTYAEPAPDDLARIVWGGFRFDIFSIFVLSTPYILLRLFWQKETGLLAAISKWVFIIPNLLGLAFSCLDLNYFAFSKRRTTADYFDIATGGGDVWNVFGSLFPDFISTALIFIAMIVLLLLGYKKIASKLGVAGTPLLARTVWSIVMIAVTVVAIRGGLQYKPITNLSAGQYTTPNKYSMVLNTPFTILQSLQASTISPVTYMDQVAADALWPVEHKLVKDPADLEGYNIVLLILESFSSDMSAVLSANESQMPFLDSLMRSSIYFEHAYANGTRSVDAVPALIAGIPYLTQEAFAYSPYANAQFESLPSVLNGLGYKSVFFHGGRNGTMGFDDFCATAGFDEYVGLDQYPSENQADIGEWGVHDGPFFKYAASHLSKMEAPYFASFFSLSSHHPYDLPDGVEDILAASNNKLHRSVRYADRSLKEFFAEMQRKGLTKRTMFIISADHTANKADPISSVRDRYHVPLLVHIPDKQVSFRSDKVIQHIDVMPMTLDFIGYEKPFFSFGQDMRGQKEGAAILREGDVYHYIGHQGVLSINGEEVLSSENASGQKMPLPDKVTKQYFSRAQACIQQFNLHVSERDLKVP